METFSALLALYAGTSPVTGEFPSQRPITRRFDVFFELRLNKRLSNDNEFPNLITASNGILTNTVLVW